MLVRSVSLRSLRSLRRLPDPFDPFDWSELLLDVELRREEGGDEVDGDETMPPRLEGGAAENEREDTLRPPERMEAASFVSAARATRAALWLKLEREPRLMLMLPREAVLASPARVLRPERDPVVASFTRLFRSEIIPDRYDMVATSNGPTGR